jgi:hypothetical protein
MFGVVALVGSEQSPWRGAAASDPIVRLGDPFGDPARDKLGLSERREGHKK